MTNGPIMVGIDVYEDFMNYASGTYSPISLSYYYYLGGHAIKLIGWGVDSKGTKYWIC